MDLLVVESPTKARTISRFLNGKFNVLSTMGHIRDLPSKKLGIEIKEKVKKEKVKGKIKEYDFIPQYEELPKKRETIRQLKEAIKVANKIYLATDPDREGEAIAYHVAVIGSNLKFKIKNSKFSRIVFHEITESAIREALAKPGTIDLKLVDAQQARRVLDRLVGYQLSPLLWRKIRRGLSAGRVQSVAVRLIVEREREIEKFVPQEYWEIFCQVCQADKKEAFDIKLVSKNGKKLTLTKKAEADPVVVDLQKAAYSVAKVEESKVNQKPVPPFTTSTMQQAAARRFGFTAKRTMRVAQSLYENGLITYHRTDSFSLAQKAIDSFRQHILKEFGRDYLPELPNYYKTRSKVAQEAHEAIRPTNINLTVKQEAKFTNNDEKKLYDLIWRRALACQMKSAVWNQLEVEVAAKTDQEVYGLAVSGRTIDFPGWLILYNGLKSQDQEGVQLPKLTVGELLKLLSVNPLQKFTQPPARFTEATLIKELEKRGIGRPSTYAPIVTTIQVRQYVTKEEGKFKPTPLGLVVNDFLVEYFANVMEYAFTAKMEDELDEVANGKLDWKPMLSEFWGPFSLRLEEVAKKSKRQKIPVESTGLKCPECGEGELVIRIGRFGKFLSCSRFPDCKYTAPYLEKLKGLKCPQCGGDVVVRRTKKGRQFYGCSNYPKCKWASWHKPKPEVTT